VTQAAPDPSPSEVPPALERYSRQIRCAPLDAAAQTRLAAARVTLIGCGALGSHLAETVVRAGVGRLRVVDRDFLEISNLQRQALFDEQDVADDLPKAIAAARHLARINSHVTIEPVVADANPQTIGGLADGADLLLDGTDNVETRYLINDAAVERGVPWVYGACIGTEGRVLAIRPAQGPCLRCIWDEPPPPGSVETCDTVGVLAPAVQIVAAMQATAAIQILTGHADAAEARLLHFDVWTGRFRSLDVRDARLPDCPCCQRREFEFLTGRRGSQTSALCGRDAIQVLPATPTAVDLSAVAAQLPPETAPRLTPYMLRFMAAGCRVTVFADGRAIVQGTSDASAARTLLARFVGT
jgi:molybdopterin/thiamine biosynthesis adenylyltransferase